MHERAIQEKLDELKKELVKLQMQRATGTTLANPGRIRQVKKTVAQLYTLRSQQMMQKPVQQQKPTGGREKENERMPKVRTS